jgi:hypothetical protein
MRPISASLFRSPTQTTVVADARPAAAHAPLEAANSFRLLRGASNPTTRSVQLAEVDVEIKQLLKAMDAKRREEDQLKDQTQYSQEAEENALAALNKTADSYHQLLDATSMIT